MWSVYKLELKSGVHVSVHISNAVDWYLWVCASVESNQGQ
jgi:hypothetical protein